MGDLAAWCATVPSAGVVAVDAMDMHILLLGGSRPTEQALRKSFAATLRLLPLFRELRLTCHDTSLRRRLPVAWSLGIGT